MEPESVLKPATTTAETTPPRTPMIRLPRVLPLGPARIDLGEQVVGSRESFDLVLPRVSDQFVGTAVVRGSIGGVSSRSAGAGPLASPDLIDAIEHAAFAVETGPGGAPLVLDTRAMRPIRVEFSPRHPGRYDAMVHLALHWSDGAVTDHEVSVTGRARALTDVPRQHAPAAPAPNDLTGHEAPSHDRSELATTHNAASVDALIQQARDSAGGLADAQRNGVATAEAESESFTARVPKAAWWATLAEIAISMGVAGIAGVVAKTLAQRLASLAHPDALDSTKIPLFTGLADGIKEGLKGTAKHTVPMPGRAASKVPSTPAPESRTEPASSNARIDFWDRQRGLLAQVHMANRTIVSDTAKSLQQLPLADRALAIGALAEALEAARLDHAARHQMFASETQWVSGIAQASLGHDDVQVVGEERPRAVTELRHVRDDNPFVVRNGLLQITVADDGHALRVSAASLRGVSQEIADQLWKRPLHGVPIPLLVKVTGHAEDMTITRDEAGRIRAEGSAAEPTLIRRATMLLDEVLGRSLQQWQLPAIETNDATGRGD